MPDSEIDAPENLPGHATVEEAIAAARLVLAEQGAQIIVRSSLGLASERFFVESSSTFVRASEEITHTIYRNGSVKPYRIGD